MRAKLARDTESNDRKKICMINASSGEVTIFACKKNANPENAVIKRCAETGSYMNNTECMVVKKLNIATDLF